MVLSDVEIRHAINRGHVICHPLIEENIRGSSIDVTLGAHYYICNDSVSRMPGIYNPFDEVDVKRYFGDPRIARHSAEPQQLLPLRGIPQTHPFILLPPRTRILAHTHEFVGIRAPGTSEIRARSSWGRNGIGVVLCAGWGDPGYINRWTLEIQNFNDEAVPIPVGERIAQVIFHQTSGVAMDYGRDGKYQTGSDIAEIVRQWVPESMLPRCYRDERRMPLPVDEPSPTLQKARVGL